MWQSEKPNRNGRDHADTWEPFQQKGSGNYPVRGSELTSTNRRVVLIQINVEAWPA
jgi:hypothetical protein